MEMTMSFFLIHVIFLVRKSTLNDGRKWPTSNRPTFDKFSTHAYTGFIPIHRGTHSGNITLTD